MNTKINRLTSSIASAIIIASPCGNLHAQSSVTVLEEIIVTAQKRKSNLIDTPISITAIGGDRLEKLGAVTLDGVTNEVPGVVFSNDSSLTNSNLTIRGISNSQESPTIDPANTIYVDEVFVGSSLGAQLSLYDIAQVEVLRGPQGTLFGRNSVGGAISIQTRQPGEEPSLDVNLSAGNYNYRRLDVSADVPLINDTLLSRFALSKVDRDGYMENQLVGFPDLNEIGRLSGRAKFLYTPSDDTDINLSLDFSKVDQIGRGFDVIVDGLKVDSNPYDRKIKVFDPKPEKLDAYGGSLKISHTYDDLTFTSISSYRYQDYERTTNAGAAHVEIATLSTPQTSDAISQEFRVSYLGIDNLDLVLGAYYFDRDLDFDAIVALGRFHSPPARGLSQDRYVLTNSNSVSVFAHGIYNVTDNLSVALGFRHTREDKSMDLTLSGKLRGPNVGQAVYDSSWSKVTPVLNLQYKFNESSNAYVTYSTGFKSGGFNELVILSADVQAYQEEDVSNFEVGLKGRFSEGRGRYSSSIYYMDWSDLQVERIVIDQDSGVFSTYVGNVGSAESYGADIEIDYLVTDNLSINTSVSYNSSEITEGSESVKTGNALGDSPQLSGNLNLDYSISLGDSLTGFIGGSVSWRDEYYASSPENIDISFQESHTNLSARIGLETNDEQYELYFWGKNLTDEVVIQRVLDVRTSPLVPRGLISINSPRTFGITFSAHF